MCSRECAHSLSGGLEGIKKEMEAQYDALVAKGIQVEGKSPEEIQEQIDALSEEEVYQLLPTFT